MSLRASSPRHSLLGTGLGVRLALAAAAVALLWLSVYWALN
jgi:hypothetical protein